MQGDFMNLLAEENENVTWKSLIYNLHKGILPFALKSLNKHVKYPRQPLKMGEKETG